MTERRAPSDQPEVADIIDEAALERAMRDVPRGALVVSAIAVALLMVGWFFVYFFIFLPRGMVG